MPQAVSIIHNAHTGIDDVPENVMRDIFLFCVSSTVAPIPSHHTAPLNLTWVCASWRRLAHGTSTLWTTLDLHQGRNDVPRWTPVVRHWAHLAGDRPLSLAYDFVSSGNAAFFPVLRSFCPFASRVRDLNLKLEAIQYAVLGSILPFGLPLLESIALTNIASFNEWMLPRKTVALDLSKCSRLRVVAIEWMPTPIGNVHDWPQGPRVLMKFVLPWSQLTSLKLVDPEITPTEVPGVLQKCTNLVECHLSLGLGTLNSNNTVSTFTAQPIVLDRLVSLTVEWKYMPFFQTTAGIAPILAAVTLPSLISMNLAAGGTPSTALFTALCELQQRSQFLLEYFSLSGDSNLAGMLDFFIGTPTLRSVAFNLFDHKVYVPLTLMLNEDILPKLLSVELSLCAIGVHNGICGLTSYRSLLDDSIVPQNFREVYSQSGKIIRNLASSRFWGKREAPYEQEMRPSKRVVLRTWRSQECPEEYQGQEWVNDSGEVHELVQSLEAEGLAFEFPVEFVERLGA